MLGKKDSSRDSKSESTSGWITKENTLEALLDGESKRVSNVDKRTHGERLEMMLEQAGLMMDFVDSLDDDQRDQFVDNIDAIVERAENRQNKEGKGQKGKGKPRR